MQRKSLKELKELIEEDLLFSEDFLDGTQGSENPQVKDMRLEEQSRSEALKDVLLYINNHEKYWVRKL